jgi:hypothetical protein
MSLGCTLMARPKKPEPNPSQSASAEDRTTIINLKGSLAYDAWLEEIHKTTHLAKAVIIRLALKAWAKQNGHREPPEL